MKQSSILGLGFLHAAGAVAYIAAIAAVMSNIENTMEPAKGSILPPILFLGLLVLSASVVGLTLFARPLLWYLDGKKKEAVQLLLSTVAVFGLIIVSLLIFLLASWGNVTV